MRKLLGLSCAFALIGAGAFADAAPAASPPSKWSLAADEFYTILLANLGDNDLTYIYRICQGDGPATRIAMSYVGGQAVVLSSGACVDVATHGSVRVTRASETAKGMSTGTYQFIYALAPRATPRNS